MSACQNTNPLVEASVKLCAAVKRYKCLHEKYSYRKTTTPECETAWELVALECKETVEFCKTRWKTLRRCFFEGLNRRGNKYYLHEYLEFLEDHTKDKNKRKVSPSSISKIKSDIRNNSERTTDDKLDNIINIYDDEEDARSISSHTTSADELNDITQQNSQVGVFIIDEIEDDMENSAAADEKRLSYKRSCKRPLDPELIDELVGEQDKSEEKRARKSVVEKCKTLPSESDNSSFTSHQINKPYKPGMGKVETHKENKIDRFTWTGSKETRNFATQYESDSQEFDDIFLQSIKVQLREMNPRQKMNFKRKIYQSLLEVFDDATDFPRINEILQLPNKQAPRVINSTVGELRLMRELVSLVQAAKNTPEIMNANENVKTSTPIPIKQALKIPPPIAENRLKAQTSPQSLSSSLDDDDDDDLQMSINNREDDVISSRSWDQMKAKPTESPKSKIDDTIKGLPRHILQKVVKVSGSGTSTIVTRDGDRKRIYRIYPKLINQNANESCSIPTKPTSNCGTFFVPSKKLPDTAPNFNRINSNVSGITIRSVNNKPTNNTSESTNSVNKSINISNSATNDQTIFKNIHPANRILCASTGSFKTVTPNLTYKSLSATSTGATNSSTSTKEVTTTKSATSPMLPPTSNVANKRNDAVRPGPQLMQRRFSICCPLPSNSAETVSKNGSSTQNGNSQQNTSKIRISQPVSLNNKVGNGEKPSSTQNSASVGNVKTSAKSHQSNSVASTGVAAISATIVPKQEEIPILETAGTVEADVLDPLFVKPTSIKSEPVDE